MIQNPSTSNPFDEPGPREPHILPDPKKGNDLPEMDPDEINDDPDLVEPLPGEDGNPLPPDGDDRGAARPGYQPVGTEDSA